MTVSLERLHGIAAMAVMGGWVALGVLFFLVRSAGDGRGGLARKRDSRSLLGMVLQGAGFSFTWAQRRPVGVPFAGQGTGAALTFAVLTVVLVAISVGLAVAARRVLGKQWSLTARVLEEHRLVTAGPYRLVRHPIYTGLLGLLVATGFAFSRPLPVLAGVVSYLVGTFIRVRSEERLLREQFGAEYEAYAARVPAVLPWKGLTPAA